MLPTMALRLCQDTIPGLNNSTAFLLLLMRGQCHHLHACAILQALLNIFRISYSHAQSPLCMPSFSTHPLNSDALGLLDHPCNNQPRKSQNPQSRSLKPHRRTSLALGRRRSPCSTSRRGRCSSSRRGRCSTSRRGSCPRRSRRARSTLSTITAAIGSTRGSDDTAPSTGRRRGSFHDVSGGREVGLEGVSAG